MFKGNSLYKNLFQLRFIFLNKVSCIFTKRRYLILSRIGVIRFTINVCVTYLLLAGDYINNILLKIQNITSQMFRSQLSVRFAKIVLQVASVCASDIRNEISRMLVEGFCFSLTRFVTWNSKKGKLWMGFRSEERSVEVYIDSIDEVMKCRSVNSEEV